MEKARNATGKIKLSLEGKEGKGKKISGKREK